MNIAVMIQADNDPSGNPRRGWIVREVREGQKYAHSVAVFVDSGYGGSTYLDRAFPNGVVVIANVAVSTREYLSRSRGREGYTFAWHPDNGPVTFTEEGMASVSGRKACQ